MQRLKRVAQAQQTIKGAGCRVTSYYLGDATTSRRLIKSHRHLRNVDIPQIDLQAIVQLENLAWRTKFTDTAIVSMSDHPRALERLEEGVMSHPEQEDWKLTVIEGVQDLQKEDGTKEERSQEHNPKGKQGQLEAR